LSVSIKQVKQFLKENSVAQQFRPVAAYFFPLSRGKKPFERCQMDLLDVSNEQPSLNSGTKFLLCFIDTLSRYAFAEPMKSKSQEESLRAFEIIAVKVMELGFTIGVVDSDMESAFRGKEFKQFTSMNHITMHFIPVVDEHGTAFVERFNRTVRILLEKLKVSQGSNEWVKFLPQLMENYNNRVHRTLGMSPKEALSKGEMTKDDSRYMQRRYVKAEGQPLNVQHLKIGDKVRFVLRKNALLDKGSAPRFSVTRHMIESEIPGGLYTVSGRVEPYRVNELLKAGQEDSKQVQMEERVVEQVAARKE